MAVATARSTERELLLKQFRCVRQASVDMCQPLDAAAFRVQPMEEASPPWWNLGHTSWFFVRNVLQPLGGDLRPEDALYDGVLNSYYVSLGPRLARDRRGSLTRPTTEEIYAYRESVDRRVERLLRTLEEDRLPELEFLLTVGMNHEQQHQELFYTEIKCILAQNPVALRQAHRPAVLRQPAPAPQESRFVGFEGGLFEFGHREAGWCWDNELPVHRGYLNPYAIRDRLATNREYLEFIDGGGYRRPLLWLDNGWRCVEQLEWRSPLYWERIDGMWQVWTLAGMQPLALDEPVCHVSFYEADAFARWTAETFAEGRGARLPSEQEWEHAARRLNVEPDEQAFLDSGRLQPGPSAAPLADLFGVLWQWTSSYYQPYPGDRPFPGALAEYNGKFMDTQRVLRGGSCATPRDHFRISYRNFWPAPTRFQFTGIRLARDLGE